MKSEYTNLSKNHWKSREIHTQETHKKASCPFCYLMAHDWTGCKNKKPLTNSSHALNQPVPVKSCSSKKGGNFHEKKVNYCFSTSSGFETAASGFNNQLEVYQ